MSPDKKSVIALVAATVIALLLLTSYLYHS